MNIITEGTNKSYARGDCIRVDYCPVVEFNDSSHESVQTQTRYLG